jgi:PKD domain-containing protein
VTVWDHEEGADCPTQPASLSCIHIVEAVSRPAGADWRTPIEVSRPGIGATPRVALDPAGDAAIIWIHDIGQDRVLQATIRPHGAATWPNANDLSGTPVEIKNHAVALDGGGNAVAVWAQRDATSFYVVGDLRPAAGGVWLAPVALSSINADATAGPALAAVPGGDVLVAWIEGGALRVAGGQTATGIWDAAVSPAGGGIATDPDVDVALSPSGDAVAAWSWRRSATAENIVQAAFRPAGAGWGAVVDLGTIAGRSHVRVAISDAGNVAAVWAGSNNTLRAAGRARSTGNWSQARTIATNVSAAGAQLSMNPRGNAVAVWTNSISGKTRGTLRPAGGAWQPPVGVSGSASSAARVELDTSSIAVAVWNRSQDQRVVVESADLRGGGPVLAGVHVTEHAVVHVKASFSVQPKGWSSSLAGAPLWRFGDGTSASGLSVRHAYKLRGVYTVTVAQSDAAGVRSTVTRKVTVAPAN